MLRRLWVPIFLVLTAGALGMELVAGLDNSPSTVPWTQLISTYIPEPVTLAVLFGLSLWLPMHFVHNYRHSKGAAMVNEISVPASAAADAKNRAFRTFVQSLAVDVGASVVLAVTPLLADVKWEKGYWVAVGLLAARSAITAGVSWAARKLVPPAP